jgi:hypothetical protein
VNTPEFLVTHRRALTIGLALTAVAIVGYGVLGTRAPRAQARQPQAVASVPNVDASPTTATPPPVETPAAAPTPAPAATPESNAPAATAEPAPPAPNVKWPERVTGKVVDAQKRPLAGASVVADGKEIRTEADGTFALGRPGTSVLVKLPGYEKATVTPRPEPLEVVLKPHVIKAAYLTYWGSLDKSVRNRVLALVDKSELNAVVIDVKGDRGWVLYKSEVPMANTIGAQGPSTFKEFEAFLAELKGRGVYTIGRIVTFKDNVLANARPDLAIIDTRTGKPWIDREQLAWVDPFREEVWNYNIALAKEAVRRGFDEVQFDYVRFPTDGKLASAKYSKPVNKDTRLPTIAAFLGKARREIGPTGGFVAADIFGYTAFNENDTDIGQRVEELAPHVDYFSPMVYPSGYQYGIPGYRNPVAHPYEVVKESVRLIRKRSGDSVVRVRPWLQDFRDYAFGRKIFGPAEIRAQIKGSDDAGGTGWMLWNPRNVYTEEALRADARVAAK